MADLSRVICLQDKYDFMLVYLATPEPTLATPEPALATPEPEPSEEYQALCYPIQYFERLLYTLGRFVPPQRVARDEIPNETLLPSAVFDLIQEYANNQRNEQGLFVMDCALMIMEDVEFESAVEPTVGPTMTVSRQTFEENSQWFSRRYWNIVFRDEAINYNSGALVVQCSILYSDDYPSNPIYYFETSSHHWNVPPRQDLKWKHNLYKDTCELLLCE